MSTVGSTILACPNPQGELNEEFETCGHECKSPESPFLQFITSAENTSGLNQMVNPGGNKTRTVVLRYDQKVSASSVNEVDECHLDCTSTNKVGDLSAEYTMDVCQKIKYDEGYNIYDFTRNCQSAENYLRKRLLIMACAIEEKLAIKTAEEAIGMWGSWGSDVKNVSASGALEVATRLTGGISLNPTYLSKIRLAKKQSGYCVGTGIFGSSELWEATDNLNVGCCADNGYDLFAVLQRYREAVMYDPYLVDALASDNLALMVQLGAMQLLTYTVGTEANFTGLVGPAGSNFELIPLITPRYGVPVDLVVSNNCGAISLIMTTSTKLVGAPLDMFPVGDRYEGVNYVNLIDVVNP